MKKILLVVSLLFSSMSFATPIDNLQKKLGSFHAMRANFQQALYAEPKVPARKSSGNMAILRPGKFRWETKAPNDQILIANGSTLWVYDVDLEQATKQKINVRDSNSPALFLSGEVGDIPKRFDVSEQNTNKNTVFTLQAKDKEDMFQSLIITFNENKLVKMAVETRLGQRSEFNFTQVELNPSIKASQFDFKPPKGVDIITN